MNAPTTRCAAIAPKLTGARCQCTGCGGYFTSERAFDRHRIGEYAKPGQWQGTRRCMAQAEMDAAGFERNAKGFRGEPGRARVATRSAIPAHRGTPAMVEPPPPPTNARNSGGRSNIDDSVLTPCVHHFTNPTSGRASLGAVNARHASR